MKTLVACFTSESNRDRRLNCEWSWAKDLRSDDVDVKFIYFGDHFSDSKEELWLEGEESYYSLSLKMIASMEYAIEGNYDFYFKCDDDTFVYGPRLKNIVTQQCEQELYLGLQNKEMGVHYAIGGPGFLLNRSALLKMKPYFSTTIAKAAKSMDDWYVGWLAKQAGITLNAQSLANTMGWHSVYRDGFILLQQTLIEGKDLIPRDLIYRADTVTAFWTLANSYPKSMVQWDFIPKNQYEAAGPFKFQMWDEAKIDLRTLQIVE